MKRALLTCTLLVAAATQVAAATTTRYLVATRRPAGEAQIRMVQDAEAAQKHDVRTFRNLDLFAATLSEAEAAALAKSADVRIIEPVVERHALGLTTDTTRYAVKQAPSYGIDLVHATEVWGITRGRGTTNVVVLDTGLDIEHPDLKDRYLGGFNTFEPEKPPIDDNRHGTHVTGIIAASDNTFGVVGVAPEVNVWAVKVLDNTGFGSTENIVRGLDWVLQKKKEVGGNWIMNLSLGSEKPSILEREAFAKLHDEGVLVIAAAGNRGFPYVDFPAAYPSVIGVGAVDQKKELSTFSSYGIGMAMVAPGVNIASTVPRGSARAVDVQVGDITLTAQAVEGSPLGNVRGNFVWCGYAFPGDCPPSVAGNIAVVRRAPGTVNHYFYEKVLVAQRAGATAVVILNSHDKFNLHGWQLNVQLCDSQGCRSPVEPGHQWPLTVGMSYPEGERLLGLMGQSIDVSYRLESYDSLSGTSMAAPHVVGAAALLWSLAPEATADQLRAALELTTIDLGLPGRDRFYGAGMLDVIAAAKRLAPEKFGIQPSAPPRRRSGGH